MATDNADELQCSASFAINFMAVSTCTVELEDPEDVVIDVIENGVNFGFTKTFIYTLDANPRTDSDSYGFDLDTSGVGLHLLTIEFTFIPSTPHYDPMNPGPKVGSVRVTGTFDMASARTMQVSESISIPLIIRMNTGTT